MKELSEVIKSLECCSNIECGYCEDCPYNDGNEYCSTKSLQDAIIYLKELQTAKDNVKMWRFTNGAKANYGVEIKTTKKVKLEDLRELADLVLKGEY